MDRKIRGCFVHAAGADSVRAPQDDFPPPNVRAKRATTAGRQARAGENAPSATGPGPGGLPLALRLSEGLGSTRGDGSSYGRMFVCGDFIRISVEVSEIERQ